MRVNDRQRKEMKSDIQADKYRQTDTDIKKRTERLTDTDRINERQTNRHK